jgi:hypothetical protein
MDWKSAGESVRTSAFRTSGCCFGPQCAESTPELADLVVEKLVEVDVLLRHVYALVRNTDRESARPKAGAAAVLPRVWMNAKLFTAQALL